MGPTYAGRTKTELHRVVWDTGMLYFTADGHFKYGIEEDTGKQLRITDDQKHRAAQALPKGSKKPKSEGKKRAGNKKKLAFVSDGNGSGRLVETAAPKKKRATTKAKKGA